MFYTPMLFGRLIVSCSLLPAFASYLHYPRNITCADDPAFLSYHIHVLFWPNNNQSVDAARTLYDAFIANFNASMLPCVQGPGNWRSLTAGGLCTYGMDMTAGGPFLTAQFAFFVPPDRFADTVPWIMQRHQQSGAGASTLARRTFRGALFTHWS